MGEKMVDFKGNLWLISIVAGIIGVITIFTPAWGYLSGSENVAAWLWGLYINNGNVNFIDLDEPIVILGIISTLIIAIGTLPLLLGGILTKVKDREISLLYLVGGILPIIGIIVFLAGTESLYSGWWSYYIVHVGTILAFIAGGLGISAGVISIMENRKT